MSPPRDMIRISASEGHSFCRPVPSRNDLDLLVRASGAPAHTVTRLGYPLAAGQVRIALHLRFPLWQQRSTSWKLAAARWQVELSLSLGTPLWRTAEQVPPQGNIHEKEKFPVGVIGALVRIIVEAKASDLRQSSGHYGTLVVYLPALRKGHMNRRVELLDQSHDR